MFSRAHRTSLCESTCLFPGSFSSSSEVRTDRSVVWAPLVMREGLWEAARDIYLRFKGTNPCKNWAQNIWQWLDTRKNDQRKLPGVCVLMTLIYDCSHTDVSSTVMGRIDTRTWPGIMAPFMAFFLPQHRMCDSQKYWKQTPDIPWSVY